MARSFRVPGDQLGNQSHGFGWPYGPVALVTPFSFPVKIPAVQLMGALYMGIKLVLRVDKKVKTNFNAPIYKQQSMVIISINTPGVKILRPRTVFGFDDAPHRHAEVIYENVHVPANNRVGGVVA